MIRWLEAEIMPAAEASEPMKRFTIDMPDELHFRVKTACARHGLRMADMLRYLLEREFPAGDAPR